MISTVIFLVLEWNNPNTIGNFSTSNKILNAIFQSITTRTAGFTTFNQSQMNPISIILCEILMFIGGSPVSMAGGIKTTTFFVLLLVGLKNTDQSGNIVFKSRKITNNIILKAVRIFIIVIVSILIGAVLIYLFEGKNVTFSAVLFESISALATVGITLGITPTLCWQSKIVISVLMFMGRIGMLTIPLAFKQKNQSADIDYADAKIIVG